MDYYISFILINARRYSLTVSVFSSWPNVVSSYFIPALRHQTHGGWEKNHHKANMCREKKNANNGNWPFPLNGNESSFVFNVYIFKYVAECIRKKKKRRESIESLSFDSLNWITPKVYVECSENAFQIHRFVGRVFLLLLLLLLVCFLFSLFRVRSFRWKKNLCTISFGFIAIINRAIELKSISELP